MSAPLQLKMFMSPREMEQGGVTHANDIWAPGGPAPMNDDMYDHHPRWKEKRRTVREAYDGTFQESIIRNGVQNPLGLFFDSPSRNTSLGQDPDKPMLRDGHHRFIAQRDADPDRLMPVHYDSFEAIEFRKAQRESA